MFISVNTKRLFGEYVQKNSHITSNVQYLVIEMLFEINIIQFTLYRLVACGFFFGGRRKAFDFLKTQGMCFETTDLEEVQFLCCSLETVPFSKPARQSGRLLIKIPVA